MESGPVPHVGMYLPSGPVPVMTEADIASGPVPIEQANIATSPIRVGGFKLSRTHLLVGGGVALVILIGIIAAIAATSGGEKATPIAKPTEVAPTPPPEFDPGPEAQGEQRMLEKANTAFDEQRYDTVIETLSKAREEFPANADMAYLAGKAYFAKLYWNDGLRAFRDAIRLDPAFRNDAELIKTVLAGFITTPSVNRDLATFLRDDIGAAAEPYLAETASDHPNANLRKRAADELKRY